jgi:saccharopine dehydrogenase-like NADP-dependent oxidoreductase
LSRNEFVRSYYPIQIGKRNWRAIAWTTSSSVCSIIEMVNNGSLPGRDFLRQENVPLDVFFATRNGQRYLD